VVVQPGALLLQRQVGLGHNAHYSARDAELAMIESASREIQRAVEAGKTRRREAAAVLAMPGRSARDLTRGRLYAPGMIDSPAEPI
jgi:hypothetical protein